MSHNANDILDKQRFGLITGSKVSVLFPDKKSEQEVGLKTYAKQLANQLYFEFYDDIGTWQTEHGNNNESSAFEYYRDRFDNSVAYKPEFAKKGYHGGSADAIAELYGVDFKCPTSLEKWLDYIFVGIDKQQLMQGKMYCYLYNKAYWKICCYLIETEKMVNNGLTYPVHHDKRMIVVPIKRDSLWEEQLIEKTPHVIELRDEFYAKLVEQFGDKLPF